MDTTSQNTEEELEGDYFNYAVACPRCNRKEDYSDRYTISVNPSAIAPTLRNCNIIECPRCGRTYMIVIKGFNDIGLIRIKNVNSDIKFHSKEHEDRWWSKNKR